MRISVRRWGASLAALLVMAVVALPSAVRADEGDGAAWLGVYTQELSPGLQDALDHPGDAVLVTRVVSGSPADRAGLKKGDLIVRVGSDEVDSPAELARVVQRHDVGDEIEIRILRDGDRRTLRATLGSRSNESDDEVKKKEKRIEKFERRGDDDADRDDDAEDEDEAGGHRMLREFRVPRIDIETPETPMAPDAPMAPLMGRARLGVRIETLNPDLAEYFDVQGGRGALVVEVIDGSAAERIGIKPGDVIVRVDGRDVADSDDLIRAIGESKGRVSVIVVRHGSRRTFEAELAPAPEMRSLRIRRPGGAWRFDGNAWQRGGATPAPDSRNRAEMERELRELREELKELKEDLKELRDR